MPIQRAKLRIEDQTVPCMAITTDRPIGLVRAADRGKYCRRFIGRTVEVTARHGRHSRVCAAGVLLDVVMDVGRGQPMLLLRSAPNAPTEAVYVGHLLTFHPQPESGGGDEL